MADVENFHPLLLLHDAEYHAMDITLVAVEQVSEFGARWRNGTSIRISSRLRMASRRTSYQREAVSQCPASIFPYRSARLRSARAEILTRYAMLSFKLFEKFSDGSASAFFHVFEALPDAFLGRGEGCNIEQALIGPASCTMAAAFLSTVSTTGRLLFLSCFIKSPERRRKVVSDWMSLVISSMGLLP